MPRDDRLRRGTTLGRNLALPAQGEIESRETAWAAIEREKQIKSSSRARKLALIEQMNPQWRDLYDDLIEAD